MALINSGHNYLLGFNNADLNFEGVISILNNPENIEIAPKSIFEISNFNLRVEDSNLDLNDQIDNYSDKLPRGQFFVNLNNYPKFIDKLVHQNFIMSKSTLKRVMAKAVNSEDEIVSRDNVLLEKQIVNSTLANAAFELKFSEEGERIGSLNLTDFTDED